MVVSNTKIPQCQLLQIPFPSPCQYFMSSGGSGCGDWAGDGGGNVVVVMVVVVVMLWLWWW